MPEVIDPNEAAHNERIRQKILAQFCGYLNDFRAPNIQFSKVALEGRLVVMYMYVDGEPRDIILCQNVFSCRKDTGREVCLRNLLESMVRIMTWDGLTKIEESDLTLYAAEVFDWPFWQSDDVKSTRLGKMFSVVREKTEEYLNHIANDGYLNTLLRLHLQRVLDEHLSQAIQQGLEREDFMRIFDEALVEMIIES